MIQNQKDYIAAAIGFAALLIILTWASCDRIEKRFDSRYSELSTQMRIIESKLDEVKGSVDRLK
jgi:F0F1-type ATP synthase membrane subunit b/b'